MRQLFSIILCLGLGTMAYSQDTSTVDISILRDIDRIDKSVSFEKIIHVVHNKSELDSLVCYKILQNHISKTEVYLRSDCGEKNVYKGYIIKKLKL